MRFHLLLPIDAHDGDDDISMGSSWRKIVITATAMFDWHYNLGAS